MEGQSNFPFVLQRHIPTCWEVDPGFLRVVLIQLGLLELPGINSWNGILLLWLGSSAGSSLWCVGVDYVLFTQYRCFKCVATWEELVACGSQDPG